MIIKHGTPENITIIHEDDSKESDDEKAKKALKKAKQATNDSGKNT
jgi:hypothetical protein